MLLTSIRRLPGILYTHRYIVYSVGIVLTTIIYLFIFKWNVFCVNLQAWHHVKRLCTLYEENLAMGSLCAPLCISKEINSLTCQQQHSSFQNKEVVFSAEWHKIKLVFKKVATNSIQPIHWYDNGQLKYPTEKEFLKTIRVIIKRKLNLTLAYDTAIRLARLKPSYYEEKNSTKRHLEMETLWYLLQDNEYLLSTIFTDKDIFPQLIGTCGPYFAVEYLEPVPSFSSSLFNFFDDSSLNEWGKRLKIAIHILELLEKFDTNFREPFHLCDIKLQHFGYSNNKKKLKFNDLNIAFPRTVINSIFKNNFETCRKDDDCEFMDCRSSCNQTLKKCNHQVGNDNFQIVCEKLFLGWNKSNTIIIPGLLISQFTPSELASLLRYCANPEGLTLTGKKVRVKPDKEIKNRLYNVLTEIEHSVNNDLN